MAEPAPIEDTEQEPPQAEEMFGLSRELVEDILAALAAGQDDRVRELILPLHYADAADLFERVDSEDRRRLLGIMGPEFDAEILPALNEDVQEEVIEFMGLAGVAAAIGDLDSDDAVHLAGQLEDEDREKLMESLPSDERAIIEQGLSYPEYSAGRLMQREMVTVPAHWTVGEAIDFFRTGVELPEDFYKIFVLDADQRPKGMVKLSALLRVQRPTPLLDIMDEDMHLIPTDMDQEEVAFLFRQQDLIAAPVVDASGRLVGRITVDDVVDVIDEEAEDDMLALAGVSDDFYRDIIDTAKYRFTWLLVNLGTAFCASMIISLFHGTIEKVVALAALMPVVASIGGNAGTQTLTVTVRALAMKELTGTNARRAVGKEALVALLNGLTFAVLAGGAAWVLFGEQDIGLIIAAAVAINLLNAGLVGILIPLGLNRLAIDPAVSSSVFLTAATDMVGFLVFLGLATLVLL